VIYLSTGEEDALRDVFRLADGSCKADPGEDVGVVTLTGGKGLLVDGDRWKGTSAGEDTPTLRTPSNESITINVKQLL